MMPGISACNIAALVTNRRRQREPRHVISLGTSCYAAWLTKVIEPQARLLTPLTGCSRTRER